MHQCIAPCPLACVTPQTPTPSPAVKLFAWKTDDRSPLPSTQGKVPPGPDHVLSPTPSEATYKFLYSEIPCPPQGLALPALVFGAALYLRRPSFAVANIVQVECQASSAGGSQKGLRFVCGVSGGFLRLPAPDFSFFVFFCTPWVQFVVAFACAANPPPPRCQGTGVPSHRL